ncbi:MAG: hypothetical protein PHF86_08030 [Candidatus Nanoarchaeia archaeon]|nr:hypothetical protein [Candidatus Nanoarchaeia archaeon]
MEEKKKVIIGLFIIVGFMIFSFTGLTGNIIKNRSCVDSDAINILISPVKMQDLIDQIYIKGTVQSRGSIEIKSRTDYCTTATAVKEYYCDPSTRTVKEMTLDCTKYGKTKCILGMCI